MNKSNHITGKLAGVILAVFFLTSCSNEKTVDNGYYFENFDNLKYWGYGEKISNETAHSKPYAAYTDSQNEFSLTFKMEGAVVKSKGYKHVNISAWCYKLTGNSTAGLIVSVEGAEKKFVRQTFDLATQLEKTNTWEFISTVVDLPDENSGDYSIAVYLWSPQKEKAFLDDVTLEFIK